MFSINSKCGLNDYSFFFVCNVEQKNEFLKMNRFIKIKPEHTKYIRLATGLIILILGIVFMMFPFIPLGYLFVIAGLFLLAYQIPVLYKLINKIKHKDKKGRVEKVEKKINEKEEKLNQKIVIREEEPQNSEKTVRD